MKWSLLGKRPLNPAPTWTGLVLAFVFAAQTFIDNSAGYPMLMAWLAVAASAGFVYFAVKSKALIGLLFIPVGGMFLLPITGSEDFSSNTATMFLAHALLAVLFAVASYTFLAGERRSK